MRGLLVHGAVSFALALLARTSSAQSGAIVGTVREFASGRPVLAASVTAKGGPDGVTARARTGADGRYRLTDLLPGTYTVVVRHFAFRAGTKLTVAVAADTATTVDVQLSRTRAGDSPVVTAVSRAEEPVAGAPATAAIIGADEIARRPAVTLAELVQGVAGIDVSRNGVLAANISARGFNDMFSGSMLMLTDGRAASLPSLRGNVPYFFPPTKEDIERIEVVPGAHSALYGPNAAAGILQVVTKSPFTSRGTTLSVDGGSQSLLRRSFRNAGVISPKVAYKVSGQYLTARDRAFDDPNEPAVYPTAAPPGREGVPAGRDLAVKQSSGEVRIDIRPTANSEFITTVGAAHVGNGVEYLPTAGAIQVRNWSLKTLQQRARIGRFSAQAYLNATDAGNANPDDLNGSFELRSGAPMVNRSRLFAAQLQHGMAIGSRHDLTYGADFTGADPETEGTVHGRHEDDDESRGLGAFVQSRTTLGGSLDLVTGLRVDRDSRVTGSRYSPRVSAVFRPTPAHTFRLSFNRAFALPSDRTLFTDRLLTPAGQGTPFDVRLVGNPPKGGFRFNRSCGGNGGQGLCMMTPTTGKEWIPIVVNDYYKSSVRTAATAIRNGLVNEFRQQGLTDAESAQLAARIVTVMQNLNPSATDIAPQLRYFGQRPIIGQTLTLLDPADIRDVEPLDGMRSSSWELGYSGVLWDKLRLSVDAWTEQRRGIISEGVAATPLVFLDKTTLARYLTDPIEQVLLSAGWRPALAAAGAYAISAGQANRLSQSPVGIVQFADSAYADEKTTYRTYLRSSQSVNVGGFDIAFDYAVNNPLTVTGSYSWVNRLTLPISFTEGDTVTLNAPNHKGFLAVQYQRSSWGVELGGRYQNGYPVTSGVYATNLRVVGTTEERVYDPIHTAATLHVAIHRRFFLGGTAFTWSLRGDNLTDHPYRSFPGTPLLRRSLMTQLLYAF